MAQDASAKMTVFDNLLATYRQKSPEVHPLDEIKIPAMILRDFNDFGRGSQNKKLMLEKIN